MTKKSPRFSGRLFFNRESVYSSMKQQSFSISIQLLASCQTSYTGFRR